MSPESTRAPSALAASIAAIPGLAAGLVARHTADGDGRCRECSRVNHGGREPWPCRIRDYADAALRLQRASRP